MRTGYEKRVYARLSFYLCEAGRAVWVDRAPAAALSLESDVRAATSKFLFYTFWQGPLEGIPFIMESGPPTGVVSQPNAVGLDRYTH